MKPETKSLDRVIQEIEAKNKAQVTTQNAILGMYEDTNRKRLEKENE